MKIVKKNITVQIRNNYELKNILTNCIEQPTIIEILISGGGMTELNNIPNTIHTIKFNYKFINPPCEIPSNIKTVIFYEYSNLLEELPHTIENIEIYKSFNHPVDKLHNNLKSLSLGWHFDQYIDNLPSSLEKIVLGSNFTHSINNLPSNVKFIYIANPNYDYGSIKKLPKSLILLQFGMNNDTDIDFGFDLNSNSKFIIQFEKNYGINGFTYSNTQYFKNFYFYKV